MTARKGMTVSISGTKSLKDVQSLDLHRVEGATFKLEILHPTGSVERLMHDTSGKLDSLRIRLEQDGTVIVYLDGKGVRREGGR